MAFIGIFIINIILLPIVIAAIIAFLCFLLFGICVSVLGLGGAALSLQIKSRTNKWLVFICFFIVALFGLLFLLPVMLTILGLSFTTYFSGYFIAINICAILASLMGIKFSLPVGNVLLKRVLQFVFCIIAIFSLVMVFIAF